MHEAKDPERREFFLKKAKVCEEKLKAAEKANRWWTAPYWRGARDSYLFMARNS